MSKINEDLLHAVWNRDLDKIKDLLTKDGIDVNYLNVNDIMFRTARTKGLSQQLRALIEQGADVKLHSYANNSVLNIAAYYADAESIKLLLAAEEIELNHVNQRGETALISAVKSGNTETAMALLESYSINVQYSDKQNKSALDYAKELGNTEIEELILEYIAEHPNNNSFTDIENIIPPDADLSPLLIATQNGDLETVRLLLNVPGIDVNLKNGSSDSALLISARLGHFEIVKALCEAPGVNIHQYGSNNQCVLLNAIRSGNLPTIRYVLSLDNIELNHADVNANTPLIRAILVEFNQQAVTELLAKDGIDVNHSNENDLSALHCAVKGGHFDTVQSLLDVEGINVNSRDDLGQTALMKAVANRNLNIINALLAANGIDGLAVDNNGRSALFHARQLGYGEVVQRLLQVPEIQAQEAAQRAQIQQRLFRDHNFAELDTHTASVHKSTSEAAIKLKNSYGADVPMQNYAVNFLSQIVSRINTIYINALLNDPKSLAELQDLIKINNKSEVISDADHLKQAIKAAINAISFIYVDFTDPVSDLTLSELFKLVQAGLERQPEEIKRNGYLRLLECLYLSQTEYGKLPSCNPGFFNNIVYSQQSVLPEVEVIAHEKADATIALLHKIDQVLENALKVNPELSAEQLEKEVKDHLNDIAPRMIKDLIVEFYTLFGFDRQPDNQAVNNEIIRSCAQNLMGCELLEIFDYADFAGAVAKFSNKGAKPKVSP